MELTAAEKEANLWSGGQRPLNASYGKLMMWFFIVSDALTFSGFLVSYGFSRFKNIDSWPIADEVFTHFPFLHGIDAPMYYVALMTFILIFSSVTMVLAVDAGHHMNKSKVTFYMLLTIIGGAVFVGSQAWEWKNFIKGEYGALETKGGQILQFINADNGERVSIADFSISIPTERSAHKGSNGVWYKSEGTLPSFSVNEVVEGFQGNKNLVIRIEKLDKNGQKIILSRDDSLDKVENAVAVVEGANLVHNEYGFRLFAVFFFFISGFHGFHVLIGTIFLIVCLGRSIAGHFKSDHHFGFEAAAWYWHFVDAVSYTHLTLPTKRIV